MKTILLIDTNILLHYERLDQIDWLKESEASVVEILIAPVILRELDKHKSIHPSKHMRKRAGERIKWLRSQITTSATSEIRTGVSIRFIRKEPLINFTDYQLNKDIADDWLIAHAIEISQTESCFFSILTADNGIFLKTLDMAFKVKFWDDDSRYKLKDEDDPDQKH